MNKDAAHASGVQFDLILPGVNLPMNEIGYYAIAMGICSFVHEIGHAFAAVLEDVPVLGIGFNVIIVIPVAYTHLNSDQLNSLRFWRRLRVLCGGVWHNILLAGLSLTLMPMLPIFFMPFYSVNEGVVVTSFNRANSHFAGGEKGFYINDIITKINDCQVTNMETWYKCLVNTIKHPPAYCIPSEYVLDHDESVPVFHTNEGVTECCDQKNILSICYEYVNEEESYSLIELPQFMCLNIRSTIAHSKAYCHRMQDKCGQGSYCIKPLMNNMTTIIQVERSHKDDIIYMGHPADLAFHIKVSKYVPKTTFLAAPFADGCHLLLKYLVVFSLGLATLNVLPCFYFDGYHILNTSINHFLQELVPERGRRECITLVITSVGTLTLIITLTRSLWHSISHYPP